MTEDWCERAQINNAVREMPSAVYSAKGVREDDGRWHFYTKHGDRWVENMDEGDLGIELAWESRVWRLR